MKHKFQLHCLESLIKGLNHSIDSWTKDGLLFPQDTLKSWCEEIEQISQATNEKVFLQHYFGWYGYTDTSYTVEEQIKLHEFLLKTLPQAYGPDHLDRLKVVVLKDWFKGFVDAMWLEVHLQERIEKVELHTSFGLEIITQPNEAEFQHYMYTQMLVKPEKFTDQIIESMFL